MAYTAGFSVSVGDPTKASDVTTLAANDDYLKAAVDGKAALSGSTNDTVATVTGANALIGEADLTFASNKLTVFGTTGTGAATASVLNLSTRETTVVDADQLGRIDFQAPAETGSDALLVTASIYAEADVAFDADNNATDIVLATAHDGAAAERFRITSQGEIGLAGANYGTDGQVLTSAGAGAAAAWQAIPAGLTFNGSTANGVVTFGNSTTADVEANLTFDGTTLAASASSGVGTISLEQTGDTGTSPEIKFVKNRGSGNAATGLSGALSFQGLDAANNTDTYAQIRGSMDDVTSGGEDGSLQFWTNSGGTLSERMRITSAGKVHIGDSDAAANELLDVSLDNATVNCARFTQANVAGDIMDLEYKNVSPDDNTQFFLRCADSTAIRNNIYSDGDVYTVDAGILTSDERLKTNIVDASDKLADLMRLQVRNYEWTPEYHPNKVGEKKIGFIAQELETVFPALISEHDIAPNNAIVEQLYDAADDTQYYVDGDDIPDDKQVGDVKAESQIPEGKAIGDVKVAAKDHEPLIRKSYKNAFVPILVKALQEVTVRLEATEARITALESA
tara:strand:- start:384 stop:2084 length:1701 start_codon:yes stop_codon:yes gene_type:complete